MTVFSLIREYCFNSQTTFPRMVNSNKVIIMLFVEAGPKMFLIYRSTTSLDCPDNQISQVTSLFLNQYL